MDAEQAIHARRSIRAYSAQPVDGELVRRVIACGHAAPSGGNLKEWRFIVVRSQEQKQALVQATYCRNNEANPPQAWLAQAPVIIAVAADLEAVNARYGRHGIDQLIYLDCACAVQNMLLCAVHLGLASCFISGFREHQLAETLGLPPSMQAVALVPLGYAAQQGVQRPCAAAQDITRAERWLQHAPDEKA